MAYHEDCSGLVHSTGRVGATGVQGGGTANANFSLVELFSDLNYQELKMTTCFSCSRNETEEKVY